MGVNVLTLNKYMIITVMMSTIYMNKKYNAILTASPSPYIECDEPDSSPACHTKRCHKSQVYQGRRKDFLIGGAQSKTTYRVVSNLYNNL